MSYILKEKAEDELSVDELNAAAQVFLAAGSETTASALTMATYHILDNPSTFQKLKEEIRSSFSNEEEITGTSTARLIYLNAVISETMRISPPGPGTFPRTVPSGGRMVCGSWVAGGMAVGIHHLSIGRSPENFYNPNSFLPERWLDTAGTEFENDKKTATQAFSFGPRNCIGKKYVLPCYSVARANSFHHSLAMIEIRTILTRMIWNFDMELHPESEGWLEKQKMFTTWHKTDMKIKLSAKKD